MDPPPSGEKTSNSAIIQRAGTSGVQMKDPGLFGTPSPLAAAVNSLEWPAALCVRPELAMISADRLVAKPAV